MKMLAYIENERNQNESRQVFWQAGVVFTGEERSGAVMGNEVREFFF